MEAVPAVAPDAAPDSSSAPNSAELSRKIAEGGTVLRRRNKNPNIDRVKEKYVQAVVEQSGSFEQTGEGITWSDVREAHTKLSDILAEGQQEEVHPIVVQEDAEIADKFRKVIVSELRASTISFATPQHRFDRRFFLLVWAVLVLFVALISAYTGYFYSKSGPEAAQTAGDEYGMSSEAVSLLGKGFIGAGATLNAGLNSLGGVIALLAFGAFVKFYTRFADKNKKALQVDPDETNLAIPEEVRKTMKWNRRKAAVIRNGKTIIFSTSAAAAPAVIVYTKDDASLLTTTMTLVTGVPPLYIAIYDDYKMKSPRYWEVLWEQLGTHQNIFYNFHARTGGNDNTRALINKLLAIQETNAIADIFKLVTGPNGELLHEDQVALMLQHDISATRKLLGSLFGIVCMAGATGWVYATVKGPVELTPTLVGKLLLGTYLLYTALVPYMKLSKKSAAGTVRRVGSDQETLESNVPWFVHHNEFSGRCCGPTKKIAANILHGVVVLMALFTAAGILSWGTNFMEDLKMMYFLEWAADLLGTTANNLATNLTETYGSGVFNGTMGNTTFVPTLAGKIIANTFAHAGGDPSAITTNSWFWWVLAGIMKTFFSFHFTADTDTRNMIAVNQALNEIREFATSEIPKGNIDRIIRNLTPQEKQWVYAVWSTKLSTEEKFDLLKEGFIGKLSDLDNHGVTVRWEEKPVIPKKPGFCANWGGPSTWFKSTKVGEQQPLLQQHPQRGMHVTL
jgi:hypothetical protein